MWPFKKPEDFLGVDIGSHSVKVAELVKRGKRPHLFTYGYSEQKSALYGKDDSLLNVEATAALLKRVCAEAKTVSKQALASLPASLVYSGYFTIPIMKKEDRQALVEREASKFLKQPIAETALDWRVIQPQKGAHKEKAEDKKNKTENILVTATSKRLIAAYTELFKAAGLQLVSLESEVFGLIGSLIGADPSPVILIDMGEEQTDFFIVEQGVPIFFRTVQIGGRVCTEVISKKLGLAMEQAEDVKRDMSMERDGGELMPLLAQTLEPLTEEISYSLEIFAKHKDKENAKPEKIILTGGGSLLAHLDTYLGSRFGIKAYLGDPWSRVIFDPALQSVLETIGPRFSVAIGLAARRLLNKSMV